MYLFKCKFEKKNRDLYNFIKFPTKSFNKKKYLKSISEKDLPFYTQVQNYIQFFCNKISLKRFLKFYRII